MTRKLITFKLDPARVKSLIAQNGETVIVMCTGKMCEMKIRFRHKRSAYWFALGEV